MTYSLLEDVRVLELGSFISAPYCGKLLADMGARVTKIEPPVSGDSSRSYGPFVGDDPHYERSGLFLYLNANKRGLTLDLGTPTGMGILRDLAAKSDVLVHNLHSQRDGTGRGVLRRVEQRQPRVGDGVDYAFRPYRTL